MLNKHSNQCHIFLLRQHCFISTTININSYYGFVGENINWQQITEMIKKRDFKQVDSEDIDFE